MSTEICIVHFPPFLRKVVVNNQNSDIWEFGKGALNELWCCGAAVKEGINPKFEASNPKQYPNPNI